MLADSKINKTTIGLGNVDNTSDANKPISSATQTALDAKASKAASNTFTASQSIVVSGGVSALNLGPSVRVSDDGGFRVTQLEQDGGSFAGAFYYDVGSNGYFIRRADTFATIFGLDWSGNLSVIGPVQSGYFSLDSSPTTDHILASRIRPVYDTVRQRLRFWQRIGGTVSLVDFTPGVREKKDLLWNLDVIPNVVRDGFPNVADSDTTGLRCVYFDETRSHLVFGRVNQRTAYEEFLSQYSLSGGWSAQGVDQTADAEGDGSKGVMTVGYQVLSAGHGSHAIGFNNLTINEGQSRGKGCTAGSYGKCEILSTNFVNENTAITITVEGDKTSIYSAGVPCATKIVAAGQTQAVLLNKVVSSSYNSGTDRTSIVMYGPILYAPAAITTPDTHGLTYKPYIYAFGAGAVGGIAQGLESISEGDYANADGVGCKSFGAYSRAAGKHAVTKNHGEEAWASGSIVDGDDLRWGQISRWHLKRKTSTGSATVLTLDGLSPNGYVNLLRIQNNAVLNCKVVVSGYCWSHQQSYTKVWDNVVLRHKSNGDTDLLSSSTPVVTTESETAGYTVALTAATNGELVITVTATQDPNRDVFWHASVEGLIAGYTAPTKIN